MQNDDTAQSVFTLKILFRLREAGGRCEGISTMYLRCSMPEQAWLKLEHSKFLGPAYSIWLFHLHSAVENTAFFPVFPLAESTAKVF